MKKILLSITMLFTFFILLGCEEQSITEETNIEEQIKDIPSDADIHINKLSFQYGGPNSSWVLKNLNLLDKN